MSDDLAKRLRVFYAPTVLHCSDEFFRESRLEIAGAIDAAAAALEARDARIAELSETWTDENGTCWCPPTAWAYAQLCRVRDNLKRERDAALRRAEDAERDAVKLYRSVLEWRRRWFPGTDQENVMRQDYKSVAAIAAQEKP